MKCHDFLNVCVIVHYPMFSLLRCNDTHTMWVHCSYSQLSRWIGYLNAICIYIYITWLETFFPIVITGNTCVRCTMFTLHNSRPVTSAWIHDQSNAKWEWKTFNLIWFNCRFRIFFHPNIVVDPHTSSQFSLNASNFSNENWIYANDLKTFSFSWKIVSLN